MIQLLWLVGAVMLWLPFTLSVVRDMDIPNADDSMKTSGYILACLSGTLLAFVWPLTFVGWGLLNVVRRAAESEARENHR